MKGRIIEIVKPDNQSTWVDSHIAEVTGQKYVNKPPHYRNSQTNAEYSHIAGGIGWPTGEKTGFVLVIAVDRKNETLHALAEATASTVKELLSECVRLRQIYGYGLAALFQFWYGDYERFATLISDFNQRLQRNEPEARGVYLSPPYDYDKENALEIWANQARGCLKKDTTGKKTLHLGDCNQLRHEIPNFPIGAEVKNGMIKDYPAVVALGGLVHTLLILRPWEKHAQKEPSKSTIPDDFIGEAAYAGREAIKGLGGDDPFEDTDEYDDGKLKSTVDDED